MKNCNLKYNTFYICTPRPKIKYLGTNLTQQYKVYTRKTVKPR